MRSVAFPVPVLAAGLLLLLCFLSTPASAQHDGPQCGAQPRAASVGDVMRRVLLPQGNATNATAAPDAGAVAGSEVLQYIIEGTSAVVALASPAVALVIQRGAMLSEPCSGSPVDGDPLPRLENLVGLSLGDSPARHDVGSLVGNALLFWGGVFLFAFLALLLDKAGTKCPKLPGGGRRRAARAHGLLARALCAITQVCYLEYLAFALVMLVSPSMSAVVVCIFHPGDVGRLERGVAGASLACVMGTSLFVTWASVIGTRRYCYAPDEKGVAVVRTALTTGSGAKPAPDEEAVHLDEATGAVIVQGHIVESDDETSPPGSVDAAPLLHSPASSDASLVSPRSAGGEEDEEEDLWVDVVVEVPQVAPVGICRRAIYCVCFLIFGSEWEPKPGLTPLERGLSEFALVFIDEMRPGQRPPCRPLRAVDRLGCHAFVAFDLWFNVATGTALGALRLGYCDAAPRVVIGLQGAYLLLFLVFRPLRSPLLMLVGLSTALLQTASLVMQVSTPSGWRSDDWATHIDNVLFALTLSVAIQASAAVLVKLSRACWRLRQVRKGKAKARKLLKQAKRAKDKQHRDLLAGNSSFSTAQEFSIVTKDRAGKAAGRGVEVEMATSPRTRALRSPLPPPLQDLGSNDATTTKDLADLDL